MSSAAAARAKYQDASTKAAAGSPIPAGSPAANDCAGDATLEIALKVIFWMLVAFMLGESLVFMAAKVWEAIQ
jgi:hypothetical protein